MRYLILIFLLMLSISFSSDRKECFRQYESGEITKKELMECSGIEDRGYLPPQKNIIKDVVVKEKQKKQIGLSSKIDMFSIYAYDIPEKKKIRITYSYKNTEGSGYVSWENYEVFSSCSLFGFNEKIGFHDIQLGSVENVKILDSKQKVFFDRKDFSKGSVVAICELKFDDKKYLARSYPFHIRSYSNFLESN